MTTVWKNRKRIPGSWAEWWLDTKRYLLTLTFGLLGTFILGGLWAVACDGLQAGDYVLGDNLGGAVFVLIMVISVVVGHLLAKALVRKGE